MGNEIEMVNDPEVVVNSVALHDICVQDVKYICTQPINFDLRIPLSGDDHLSCRGEETEPFTPNVDCDVIVFCAEEKLKSNCMGVDIKVGFQIILKPKQGYHCPTQVINEYKNFDCTKFYPFPTGQPIWGDNLKRALRTIDGSCIVVQGLECNISDGKVYVHGALIDKLWKYENLIVEAETKYPESVTVCQEFPDPHKIGQCTTSPTNGFGCGCC